MGAHREPGDASAGRADRPPGNRAARFRAILRSRVLPFEWAALAALALLALALERLPVAYNLPELWKTGLGVFGLPLVEITAALFAVYLLWAYFRSPRSGRLAHFKARLAASPCARAEFWADTARAFAAVWIVLTAHFLIKISIRLLNPRVFDPWLWRYDRILGLGHDPVLVLLSWLSWPPILHAVDLVYSVLYGVIFMAYLAVLAVASPTRALRIASVAGFCLLWIAGGLLYVAFPSWGPVYTRPAHFEPALQSMPITVHVQTELYRELKALFDDPTGPRPIRYGGVAAFPSLHLAVLTLFVLASWRVNRIWGGLNLAIWAVMFVGSMVTGYHYLSDSLAGAVLGAACYLGALRWTRWALGSNAGDGRSRSREERQSASPLRDTPRQS